MGDQLLACGLISSENEENLRSNNILTEADRADSESVSILARLVEKESRNYHTFLKVLQTDPLQYKTILSRLLEVYTKYTQQDYPQSQPGSDACYHMMHAYLL